MPDSGMAMVVAGDVTSPTFESLIGRWPGTSQLSKAALARQ